MGNIERRLERLEKRRYSQIPEAERHETARAYLQELYERRQERAMENIAMGREEAPRTDVDGIRSKAIAELYEVIERRTRDGD